MTDTATASTQAEVLLSAVRVLRDQVAGSSFPVPLPEASAARTARSELLGQLDDYVLPRLASLDAPVLAVVGGSTGAGKSTLVNSLVGTTVTRPGVLRPTTRSPVLVHAPDDERWFTDSRVLPDLARVTGRDSVDSVGSVRLVPAASLPTGLAVLDAPDIDSVVEANRGLARQLLAAADLWLFVTTAARYADAVPWALLRQAAERGTSVAVILDRVPSEATDEIRDHLSEMLRDQGLLTTPIFTISEVPLGSDGLLPEAQVTRLRSWLSALAKDQQARGALVRQTLGGALDSLDDRTQVLAQASRDQLGATAALVASADTSFAVAVEAVTRGMSDGQLLRGEVLARWQEFVGTGEFFRQVESTVAHLRDRLVAMVKSDPAPSSHLGEALESGVAELVRAEGLGAVSATTRSWHGLVGGTPLLEQHPELSTTSRGFGDGVSSLIHDWQGDVLTLVRTEGRDRRTTARVTAYGVNAVGTLLILVTLASTGGLTGAEAGIAGGTALLGQRLLEAIFGDQAVRSLAVKARAALIERVHELYAVEQRRYEGAVSTVEIRRDQGRLLASAALAVRAAR
ncbi:MAG: ABC transporter [Lapillicoccus sp.]